MKLQQTLVLICATIYSFTGNVNGQLTNSTTDAAVNPFLSIFHYLSPASWMPVANNVVPAVAVNHIPDCSPTDQQTPENSDQNRVKPQDHHKAIHSQKEAKVHQHKGKSHYHEKHQEKIHNRER